MDFPGESEIDDFDVSAVFPDQDDVLRLEVEVDDVVLVEVGDALADLAHEEDDLGLGEVKLLRGHALEELSA